MRAPVTSAYVRTLAARIARGLHELSAPRKQRAQGKPGARCTRSLACKMKKAYEHSHHRFAETIRPSLRNGFTAYIALSPVTGLFCHRRLAELLPRNLTPASGRQDHTTSPSALASLVLRRQSVHRIPHPTFVTMANAPLDRGGTRGRMLVIWGCDQYSPAATD
jgi:hypothetical protein